MILYKSGLVVRIYNSYLDFLFMTGKNLEIRKWINPVIIEILVILRIFRIIL
jgi:hypothetical protein